MTEFYSFRTISERLSEATSSTFVGREEELSTLTNAIESPHLPYLVAFIHGPGGIGKSRLLKATLNSLSSDINLCVLDCRGIEPTPEGFQMALSNALEMETSAPDLASILGQIGGRGQRTVVALDTYETFGLMDNYLRQAFVPALPDNVFTIFAGRQEPNLAWYTSPGWKDLFREFELHELPVVDAQKLLHLHGLTPEQIERVISFTRGFPLALEMAAAAIRTQPDLDISGGPPPKVLEQLTQAFMSGLHPDTIEAVEVSSTVRRVTESFLRSLLDVSDVRRLFEQLEQLPFIHMTSEGLVLHDVVRETMSKNLAWRDPERYRTCRRRAFSYFTKESYRAETQGLWKYTADLLYMIENPLVRHAFFPEDQSNYRVEPATVDDGEDILDISKSVDNEESNRITELWWHLHPEAFSVAKSRQGDIEAYNIHFGPEEVSQDIKENDPVTRQCLRHLKENPIDDVERVYFCRKWLGRLTGEAVSPAVGACFLDVKRVYMERRPSLRRLYTSTQDLSIIENVFLPLGFVRLPDFDTPLNGTTIFAAMVDFGPSSIDGWLANLIGAQLGEYYDHTEAEQSFKGITFDDGRLLVSVLFTDIVGSTEKVVTIGDARWRDLIERHHDMMRSQLARYQGREIDTAGDGFLATFDKPGNAIECACAMRDAIREIGLCIRAGVHLGECEVIRGKVRGIAVHIGARVASKANEGEILVSGTVKDAVAGSNIRFEDRGSHSLKGIPGTWPLFAVKLDTVS